MIQESHLSSAEPNPQGLKIAIGIIVDHDGHVFIAKRKQDTAFAGSFEFPGGKVESNESIEDALVRELQEEVGITPQKYSFFGAIPVHTSTTAGLELNFFIVTEWLGNPHGNENQITSWIKIDKLDADKFPPANQRIIQKLKNIHANG